MRKVVWGVALAAGCAVDPDPVLRLYVRVGDADGGPTAFDARWGLRWVRSHPCDLDDTGRLDWPGVPGAAPAAPGVPAAWPRTDGAPDGVGAVATRPGVRIGLGPWCRLELVPDGTLTATLYSDAEDPAEEGEPGRLDLSLALPALAVDLDAPLEDDERRLAVRLGGEDFVGGLAGDIAAGGRIDVTDSRHEALVAALVAEATVWVAADLDLTPVGDAARGAVTYR